MLVESFDAAEYKVHTIEGNVGDKVGGRTVDLKNAVDVSKIAGGTGATNQSVMGPARTVADDFGGGLIGGMREVNAGLVEIDSAQGWIQSADVDAATTEWTGASGAGNES
jgi:hypothetical protein